MAAGSIRKRMTKKGPRWQAIVDLGFITGKRRQRSKMCLTERDAKKALAALQVEADRGRLTPRTQQTITALAERWLDEVARGRSPRTYADYEYQIRHSVLPHLGALQVQELRVAHVRTWLATLQKANATNKPTRTMQFALLRLRQVLDMAVTDGLVGDNAARQHTLTMQDDDADTLQTWTAEEACVFLATAQADASHSEIEYGPIWLVSLATGMRRGEILGLRWQDVEWDRHVLRVRQTVGLVRGVVQIKPSGKSKNATRDVLVDETVTDALRAHRARQGAWRLKIGDVWEEHGLVFASRVGTPINPNNLYRLYKRLLAASGVPAIRIHDQRHTHVTWALEEGADLKAVSQRVGHADIRITAEIYQHAGRKLQEDIVTKVGAKLTPHGRNEAQG